MKKILIPTDFSEISKNAVIYGFNLAESFGYEVELIHILEIYKFAAGTSEAELISTILPAENIAEMEASAGEAFHKFINSIQQEFDIRIPYSTQIITGHLVNEMVVRSAMPLTALIVLAVPRSQDLMTRFTHNTISSIMSDAHCPVLVVPSGSIFAEYKKVILASDFQKAEISMIKDFIEKFCFSKPIIEVLHVTSKTIDFKTELKMAGMKHLIEERTKYEYVTYKLVQHKNIVQKIIDEAKDANLLLMLKEHESFFKSLFDSSKTEKITHYLKIPMLSYREELFD